MEKDKMREIELSVRCVDVDEEVSEDSEDEGESKKEEEKEDKYAVVKIVKTKEYIKLREGNHNHVRREIL